MLPHCVDDVVLTPMKCCNLPAYDFVEIKANLSCGSVQSDNIVEAGFADEVEKTVKSLANLRPDLAISCKKPAITQKHGDREAQAVEYSEYLFKSRGIFRTKLKELVIGFMQFRALTSINDRDATQISCAAVLLSGTKDSAAVT